MMKVRMREREGVKGDSWGWNLQWRIRAVGRSRRTGEGNNRSGGRIAED
jgi:hypothetical protein